MATVGTKILDFCTAQNRSFNSYRIILIVILGALAYSNTLNSPFSFDDSANIANNPQVMNFGLSGLLESFASRRAVGIISFQLNHLFFGWNVFWYHVTNIFIHLAASLTVYRLLQLLMQTPYMEENADDAFRRLPIPFFAALIFVAHPVQTQAVTYIVQRFTSLATLFYLAATFAYLKARLSRNKSQTHSLAWFLAVLCFALLAFYTKEIAYTLPLSILLVELLFFRCSRKKIYYLIAAGSSLLLAIFLKLATATQSVQSAISALDEATRLQTITSRTDYLFTQFRVIMTYLRLLFLPLKQRLDYDYVLSHSFFDWRVFCSFLVLTALLLTAFWLVRMSGNGCPHLRLTAFGIFWFFLTLSVESSIIPIIDLIFEHRLYLPSFGAITAVSTTVLALSWHRKEINREVVCTALLLISILLAITAYNRNSAWSSEVSIWADAAAKSPHSARAWNNLGASYLKVREPLHALKAIIRSVELDPSKADAWNNIGIAIDIMGAYNDRFHRTTEMFRTAGSLEAKVVNSWLAEVNNNLGLAYEINGNFGKAADNYRNAAGYNPSLGLAYYNLGIISAKTGDEAEYSKQQQILWMLDPALAERLQARVGKR